MPVPAKFDFEIDGRALSEMTEDMLTEVLTAASKSVGSATRKLEKDLEAQTRAAAPGKAWRAWKSAVYPRGGKPAYAPVGEVFANGGKRSKGMLAYWSLAGTNRAKGNKYLAVPLDAAKGSFSGRDISPRQFQARFGVKLRPLFRSGKVPLLVADGALTAGGFVPAKKAAAKKRGGQKFRKSGTIAVFALIEEQPHANRVSIGSAVRRARDDMIGSFARAVAPLGR